MEGIVATVHAAEAKQSPAMILLFPWSMQYGANLLVNLAADACVSASVPITLHMDHGKNVKEKSFKVFNNLFLSPGSRYYSQSCRYLQIRQYYG